MQRVLTELADAIIRGILICMSSFTMYVCIEVHNEPTTWNITTFADFVDQHCEGNQVNISSDELQRLDRTYGRLARLSIEDECTHRMVEGTLSFPWKRYFIEDKLQVVIQQLTYPSSCVSIAQQ